MPTTNRPILIFVGGHHSSALPVAQNLKTSGWDIFWIGHRRSQWQDKSDSAEYLEVTGSGIPFFDLKAGKIYRTLHPAKLVRLPWGFIQALFILLRLKIRHGQPRGIVSFGGYLAAPVVFCGWLLGIPSITHEQTPVSGWANKFISHFVKKIAVSWPSSLAHYPRQKAILTGLPLRPEVIKAAKKSHPKIVLNQIYITGGKQGSHLINEAVFASLPQLLTKFTLIHQTGGSSVYNDYSKGHSLRAALPPNLQSRYQLHDYLSAAKAASALGTSQVVVSRSGAHITQELALLGTRAVLIPIPWSSHQEQLQNALLLKNAGQAVILSQEQLTGLGLLRAIDRARSLTPQPISVITTGLDQFIQLIKREFADADET